MVSLTVPCSQSVNQNVIFIRQTQTPSQVPRAPPLQQSPPPQQSTIVTGKKRVFYTPELKLKLVRIYVDNSDRYLDQNAVGSFWTYVSALFRDVTGVPSTDIRKKISTMVSERQTAIQIQNMKSGVAEPASTDLEQAIDKWIEIIGQREEEEKKSAQSLSLHPTVSRDQVCCRYAIGAR